MAALDFWPLTNEDGFTSRYLVTYRHVAKRLDLDFFLRVNAVEGGVDDLEVEHADWQYHPDENVDIAVSGIMLNALRFKHLTLPLSKTADRENIACGQRIHIAGLFRLHFGAKRNVSIVHTGHISALADPEERVPIKDRVSGNTILAESYIVEVQTLEGLSGSPVFIQEYKAWGIPSSGRDVGVIRAFGEVSPSWDLPRFMDCQPRGNLGRRQESQPRRPRSGRNGHCRSN